MSGMCNRVDFRLLLLLLFSLDILLLAGARVEPSRDLRGGRGGNWQGTTSRPLRLESNSQSKTRATMRPKGRIVYFP